MELGCTTLTQEGLLSPRSLGEDVSVFDKFIGFILKFWLKLALVREKRNQGTGLTEQWQKIFCQDQQILAVKGVGVFDFFPTMLNEVLKSLTL